MKTCTKCKDELPLESFPKDRSRKDGLNNKCRACCLKQWQEWRAKNLERSQQYHREYRARNPEKVALWASRHAKPAPGKAAEYSRAWRDKHPDLHLANARSWRQSNSDKVAAASKKWREDHPERHAQRSARYKARKRANTVEPVDYASIIERDGSMCHICGEAVDMALPKYHPKSKSFDHVIPLAKGGPHSMDNVKLSHFGCNSRKGAR
jgi:hypothetical protein